MYLLLTFGGGGADLIWILAIELIRNMTFVTVAAEPIRDMTFLTMIADPIKLIVV